MAQQTAIKNPEITKTLAELASILPDLFRKMKESRVMIELMNLPHNEPYRGKPCWKYLPQIDPSGVRLVKEGLAFMHENSIYYIHHPREKNFLATLKSFLEWATESLMQLTKGAVDRMSTLKVPESISFFSVSTLPPRKPSPVFG